jgi:hypothetical protein
MKNNKKEFWKKTLGDINPNLSKEESLKPYFDSYYWTNRNPKYDERKTMKLSRDMLEWFLRYVNHLDFNSCSEQTKIEISFAYIHFFPFNLEMTDKDKRSHKWFNQLEHLITTDEWFYALLPMIWIASSDFFIDKEKMFSRYKRDQVSLENRLICGDFFHEFFSNKISIESNIQNLEKYSEDDYVTIYRNFKVEKGKGIRESNERDNPEYFIQNEGRGWSYSTSKERAIRLSGNLNTFHYKKYCGMDANLALKEIKKTLPQSFNKTNKEGFYSCVGVYKVKKKDIILYFDYIDEKEIIVNPEKSLLVDYYFLNLIDYTTAFYLQSLQMNVESDIQNIDTYFNIMRSIVSKYFKDQPDKIPDLLLQKLDFFENSNLQSFLFKEIGVNCLIESFVDTHDYNQSNFVFKDSNGKKVRPIDERASTFRPVSSPMKFEKYN